MEAFWTRNITTQKRLRQITKLNNSVRSAKSECRSRISKQKRTNPDLASKPRFWNRKTLTNRYFTTRRSQEQFGRRRTIMHYPERVGVWWCEEQLSSHHQLSWLHRGGRGWIWGSEATISLERRPRKVFRREKCFFVLFVHLRCLFLYILTKNWCIYSECQINIYQFWNNNRKVCIILGIESIYFFFLYTLWLFIFNGSFTSLLFFIIIIIIILLLKNILLLSML